jgi:hypothetical protein
MGKYLDQVPYTVDFSKYKLSKVIFQNSSDNLYFSMRKLTVLICLQQVLIKNYYKNKEKGITTKGLEE